MAPLQSHISAMTITMALTGDVQANRFVTVAGAQAGAGDAAVGISRNDEVAGRAVAIDVIAVVDMVAGAAIALGARVQSNADGLPITKGAGVDNGLALTAAANAGDIVKILIK
mgnify:CR=1 FL=1